MAILPMAQRTGLAVVCIAACCSVLIASRSDAAEPKIPAKENFHLFVLAGQSNMAGRGKVPSNQQPHPRILVFTKQRKWEVAVDPLHFDKPGIVGVGLGRSFALALVQADPTITVGLIPCAVGGSPIDSWQPGGYHQQTKSHPYDDALPRIQQATKGGTLKAILWHQGESDCAAGKSEVYQQKLHQLIGRFRSVLKSPKLPFIAGQMGQFSERPWNDHKRAVDAAHRTLPDKVSATAFVSSDKLKHKGDQVHFDSDSYREFGRRYAKQYLRLQTQ